MLNYYFHLSWQKEWIKNKTKIKNRSCCKLFGYRRKNGWLIEIKLTDHYLSHRHPLNWCKYCIILLKSYFILSFVTLSYNAKLENNLCQKGLLIKTHGTAEKYFKVKENRTLTPTLHHLVHSQLIPPKHRALWMRFLSLPAIYICYCCPF